MRVFFQMKKILLKNINATINNYLEFGQSFECLVYLLTNNTREEKKLKEEKRYASPLPGNMQANPIAALHAKTV